MLSVCFDSFVPTLSLFGPTSVALSRTCLSARLWLNNIRLRPSRAREQFSKTLWRVDAHASDGLAVESAEMGFVAGKEGLALVLDGEDQHRAVFFRQEQVKAWRG